MRPFHRLIVGLLLLATVGSRANVADDWASQAPFVPGEVIIRFSDQASEADKQRVLAALGATRSDRLGRQPLHRVRLSKMSVEQAVAAQRGERSVAFVEPNYIWRAQDVPDDPLFDALWGMRNTGQTGGTSGADIRAASAWDVFTGSSSVVVGVIDSGIDYDHPDLADNIFVNPGEIPNNGIDDDANGYIDDVRGWDCVNDDNDPFDDRGHGTHVAGTIGAVGNNGTGVAGVSWNVQLMPLKFLSSNGTGTTTDAIECLDYATMMGARITNNSWGGGGYSMALRDAIQRAADDADALFVAAAGNSGLNTDAWPHYPSGYDLPNIISVAATDANDQLAGFSNYGSATVDLGAPGVAIFSTLPGAGYGFNEGTSMASPHVTGAMALLMGRFPTTTSVDLKNRILAMVDVVPALQGRTLTGGRLNAFLPIADPDDISPDPVSDLTVVDSNATRVTLTWTATGDDGGAGQASRIEVRYSTSAIDELNYASAWLADDPPDPRPAGLFEQMIVSGLDFGTTYHFAIKAFDEFGNASAVSNNAVATTLGPPALSVNPSSVSADLFTGEVDTRTLALHNAGDGEALVRIETGGGAAAQGNSAAALPAGDLSLLILESQADVTSIRVLLETFPAISTVDVQSAWSSVPTLEELSPYDSVMLVFNYPPYDRAALGDVLADYVDQGGGLVMTLASIIYNWNPTGRFLSDGYIPVNPGYGPIGASTLGSFDVSHPIMEGVTTAWGDVLAAVSSADEGVVVAEWDFGEPFVVTKGPGVVAVNVYLSGPARWAGDVPLVLRNAVVWSSSRAHWLGVDPVDLVVPQGGSVDVAVIFDASGLDQGDYQGEVRVYSDDPINGTIAVPASLHVTAAPDIGVSEGTLDFGAHFIGTVHELALTVVNDGKAALTVNGVSADSPEYGVNTPGFTLAPRETRSIPVTFLPGSPGLILANLTIASDDPDEAQLVVELRGEGLVPPDVGVTPSAVSESLFTGETSTRLLTITNSGGSDLDFTLDVRRDVMPPPGVAAPPMGSGFGAAGDPGTPTDAAPPDYMPQPTASSTAVGATVLIVRDSAPWGSGANEQILSANGVSFDSIYSTQLAATDLHAYQVVLVPSDQGSAFYSRFAGQAAQVEDYVTSGGVLEFHASGWGWVGGDASLVTLPGGMRIEHYVADENHVLDLTHALVQGIPDPFTGSHASHAHFLDVPAGAAEVVADDAGVTNLVVYGHGNGAVVAGGQAFEWGYDRGQLSGAILANMIPFAQGLAKRWVTIDPIAGSVPAGGSVNVSLAFDATGLFGGSYHAEVAILSNDPDETRVSIPVLLDVTGAGDIRVSPSELDFGQLFVGLAPARTLHVTNVGTDVLSITGLVSDNPTFTFDSNALDIPAGETRDVGVTFTPSAAVVEQATLTIESNDPDSPSVSVSAQGEGLVPPDISVTPTSLTANLFTGQQSPQGLTIANLGGNDLQWAIAGVDPPPLEELLGAFNAGGDAVSVLIPNRFNFSEGTSGAYIYDGGSDMFDGGNFVSTSLLGLVAYTGGQVQASDSFGPGGRYFTQKRTGLFILAADLVGVDEFIISGDLGADGAGSVDGTVLQTTQAGVTYLGFVKRVFGAANPSVNHLIIVRQTPGVDHEISTNTNDDYHRVFNLGAADRLFYLLYAGAGGYYIDDAATLDIMDAFLEVMAVGGQWLSHQPSAGTLPPGGSVPIDVLFNAFGLDGGSYAADLVVASNDPDEAQLVIPATLQVTAAPDIEVLETSLDFGSLFIGLQETRVLRVRNRGAIDLQIDASCDRPDFSVSPATFLVAPGATFEVAVTFSPASAASIQSTLSLVSNDPDEGSVPISLQGEGLLAPDIDVAPSSIAAQILAGQTETRVLTVSNTGGNDLVLDMNVAGGLQLAPEVSATIELDWEPGENMGAADHAGPSSGQVPAGYQWEPVEVEENSGATVLIVEDSAPWGGAAIEEALSANGRAYDRIGGTAVAQAVLSEYDLVIVAGDQPDAFYAALAGARGKLEEYVSAGGTLIFGAAGWGFAGGDASVTVLPGGVTVHAHPSEWNEVADAAHPLVQGLPGALAGTLASHAWFADFPGERDEVLRDDQGHPTLVAYRLGAGRIVAAGLPYGFGYDQGQFSGLLLLRTLAWALQQQASSAKLLDEDWERGSFSGWEPVNGTTGKEVTSETAANGTQYSFHRFNSSIGYFDGIYRYFTPGQPGYVGLWLRSGATNQEDGFFMLRDSNSRFPIWIWAGRDGRLNVNSFERSFVYEANRWYHIEFKDIDWTAKNTDFYVDGELIRANIPFVESAAVNVARVDLFNYEYNSEAWWDEIFIADEAPSPFVSVVPQTAVVSPGGTLDVQVTLDAIDLIDGDYSAGIDITSNDPDEPEIIVPVSLHVVGTPDVDLSSDSIAFSPLYLGYSQARTLTVSNIGSAILSIASIAVDHAAYVVNPPGPFDLYVAESRDITITFAPTQQGPAPATLTVLSNDPDEAARTVTLSGLGVTPPEVEVAPTEVLESLHSDESSIRTLTISNLGVDASLDWQLAIDDTEDATLAGTLDRLNGKYEIVTGIIPNRYEFSGGESGTSITDGGDDMYDGGNRLWTSVAGSSLSYTGGQVVSSYSFGAGGHYFTQKYPGLFVLAAEPNGIGSFEIVGNLGADGEGSADGVVLHARVGGVDYAGFVKRVYGASDPSVNHLIIVEETPGAWHAFPPDTNSDAHIVNNIAAADHLYYLLYAGADGSYIDDAATQVIMERFLQAIQPDPPWLSVDPQSGSTVAGDYDDVTLTFDATGLIGGDYLAGLTLDTNDPDEPVVSVPVALHVIGIPDIELSVGALDFGSLFLGLETEMTLTVSNAGTDALTVSDISTDRPDYTVNQTSMTLAIGEVRQVTVRFVPAAPGMLAGTLEFHSDDPDEGVASVALSGIGVIPPDIELSPTAYDEWVPRGGLLTRTLTVANTGATDLDFELAIQGSAGTFSAAMTGAAPGTAGLANVSSAHAGYAPSYPSAYAVALTEDFEDGDFDGWVIGGGQNNVREVTNATAANGSSYSYHEVNFLESHQNGIYRNLDEIQPAYIGFWIRSGSVATDDGYFVCSGPSGTAAIHFFAYSDGRFFVNDYLSPGPDSFYYSEDTWYHVEFKNIDYQQHVFDYFVDGTLIRPAIRFLDTGVGNLSRVRLYSLTPGSEAYWDEIIFADEEPIRWLEAHPTLGTVPPGESLDVTVTFDATTLTLGSYDTNIVVLSNDPDQSRIVVPVHADVLPPPVAELAPLEVTAALPPHSTLVKTKPIRLSNTGGSDLLWSAETPAFASAEPSSGAVPPGGSVDVVLTFTSMSLGEGDYAADLTVHSNDPSNLALPLPLELHVREIPLDLLDIDLGLKQGGSDAIEIMLQLPQGYDPYQVVISTVSVSGVPFGGSSRVIEDRNGDGVPELYLRFDSAAFGAAMSGASTATVTGEVRDVAWFRGEHVMRFDAMTIDSPSGGDFLIVGETITIHWLGCCDASEPTTYEVWISRDAGATWSLLGGGLSGSTLPWAVTGPATAEARILVYALENGDVVGYGHSSGNFFVREQALPPAPVDTLVAEVDGLEVVLSWQAPRVDYDHGPANLYHVRKASSSQGPFVDLGTTAATAFSIAIEPPAAAALFYQVVPANSAGESPN